MRKATLLRVSLLGLGIIVLTGAAQAGDWKFWDRDAIDGSGRRVTEQRDVEDFNRIRIECACDLDVRIGSPTRVSITFDDNLIEDIEIRTRRGQLRISCDEEYDADEMCLVEVTVPSLERVTLDGAGDIRIYDFEGDAFEWVLNGAGDLEIGGRAGEFEVELNGAGDVDGRELQADRVTVDLSGVGSVRVWAEERFRGAVNGVGHITYYGDPEVVREHVGGIGSIRGR